MLRHHPQTAKTRLPRSSPSNGCDCGVLFVCIALYSECKTSSWLNCLVTLAQFWPLMPEATLSNELSVSCLFCRNLHSSAIISTVSYFAGLVIQCFTAWHPIYVHSDCFDTTFSQILHKVSTLSTSLLTALADTLATIRPLWEDLDWAGKVDKRKRREKNRVVIFYFTIFLYTRHGDNWHSLQLSKFANCYSLHYYYFTLGWC